MFEQSLRLTVSATTVSLDDFDRFADVKKKPRRRAELSTRFG